MCVLYFVWANNFIYNTVEFLCLDKKHYCEHVFFFIFACIPWYIHIYRLETVNEYSWLFVSFFFKQPLTYQYNQSMSFERFCMECHNCTHNLWILWLINANEFLFLKSSIIILKKKSNTDTIDETCESYGNLKIILIEEVCLTCCLIIKNSKLKKPPYQIVFRASL